MPDRHGRQRHVKPRRKTNWQGRAQRVCIAGKANKEAGEAWELGKQAKQGLQGLHDRHGRQRGR